MLTFNLRFKLSKCKCAETSWTSEVKTTVALSQQSNLPLLAKLTKCLQIIVCEEFNFKRQRKHFETSVNVVA